MGGRGGVGDWPVPWSVSTRPLKQARILRVGTGPGTPAARPLVPRFEFQRRPGPLCTTTLAATKGRPRRPAIEYSVNLEYETYRGKRGKALS